MRGSRANVAWSTCTRCGKRTYSNRKDARKAIRAGHAGDGHMNAYECPYGRGWHVGHTDASVISGHRTRESVYVPPKGATR